MEGGSARDLRAVSDLVAESAQLTVLLPPSTGLALERRSPRTVFTDREEEKRGGGHSCAGCELL